MRLACVFLALALAGCSGMPLEATQLSPAGPAKYVPRGYIGYCERHGASDFGCQAEFAQNPPPALNAKTYDQLSSINTAVNRAIWPRSDESAFGVSEQWTIIPERGTGDCDDYVATKIHRLVAAGWPRHALRMAMVHSSRGGAHLVLAVDTDKGTYVLDNTTRRILPWDKTGYTWQYVEVPGTGRWRSMTTEVAETGDPVPDARAASTNSIESERDPP